MDYRHVPYSFLHIASVLISQILLPSSKLKSHLALVLNHGLAVYLFRFCFLCLLVCTFIIHIFNLTKVVLLRKELPVPKHLRGQHVMYLITVISV